MVTWWWSHDDGGAVNTVGVADNLLLHRHRTHLLLRHQHLPQHSAAHRDNQWVDIEKLCLCRNTSLRISFNVCRLFVLKVWSSTHGSILTLDWPFTFSACQYLHILSNSIRNIDFSSQGNCIWRPLAHFHNSMQGCWLRRLGTTRIMTTVTTLEVTTEDTTEVTLPGWRLPRTGNQWPSWGHTTWALCWPEPWPPRLRILSNIFTISNILIDISSGKHQHSQYEDVDISYW